MHAGFSVSFHSRSMLQSSLPELPGVWVRIEDTIKGFNMIMDGEVDEYPEAAFNMVGTIEEAIAKGEKTYCTGQKR